MGLKRYYKLRTIPTSPIARKGGIVSVHRAVLYRKIGAGPHPCHWCGELVNWAYGLKHTGEHPPLIADHLNGDTTNNTYGNLVPSCFTCNATRRGPDQPPPRDVIVSRYGCKQTALLKLCRFCRKVFLCTLTEHERGNGHYCSRSCRTTHRHELKRAADAASGIFRIKVGNQQYSATERRCMQCRRKFLCRLGKIAEGKGRFCSKSCATKWRRLNRPNRNDNTSQRHVV